MVIVCREKLFYSVFFELPFNHLPPQPYRLSDYLQSEPLIGEAGVIIGKCRHSQFHRSDEWGQIAKDQFIFRDFSSAVGGNDFNIDYALAYALSEAVLEQYAYNIPYTQKYADRTKFHIPVK